MLGKVFRLVKSIGVKKFLIKGSIYFYRKSGLQGIFSRHYPYEHDLSGKFGNLKWEWANYPVLTVENLNKISEYIMALPDNIKDNIKMKGTKVLNGNYTLFSYHEIYQEQIDFNLDPLENIKWPIKNHSSYFSQFDSKFGDIKRVWELNRFVFAEDLVSAYYVETNFKRKQYIRKKFIYLLESWLVQNPHDRSVAWACSQETSIRCINLIFIFRLLECDEEGKFARLFKNMLALSARHVFKEIEYAKTQRNNHAITESAFLILFSAIFPSSKLSHKYFEKGIGTLSFCLHDQFYQDGTYIQNSLTYQRFALQSLIMIDNLLKEEPLKAKIHEILNQNLVFLYNVTFGSEGDFPNYGPNDGALLFNWSSSDYRDMRPLLNLLSLKTTGVPVFDSRKLLIDAVFMIEGSDQHFEKIYKPERKDRFDESGYYIMKSDEFSVFFRCGSYNKRYPSQNDMLHIDVWLKGKPLLIDSGSFEYFGASGLDNFHYFLSTAAHNTIKISKLDQLDKGPRFTWLSSINSKIISFNRSKVVGESYAYQNRLEGNPVHQRSIELFSNQLVVVDNIINVEDYLIELFWHTTENSNISVLDKKSFCIDNKKVKISFDSNSAFSVDIIKTFSSEYYAKKQERQTFLLTTRGEYKPILIKTIIDLN